MIPAYRAMSFAGFGLKSVVRLYKKIEFRLEGYVFQPYQEIIENALTQSALLQPAFVNRAWIGSSAIVYNSLIGPLSIGANYYDKKTEHFTFNINIGYILFNRKALP
jgi:NTE family protein